MKSRRAGGSAANVRRFRGFAAVYDQYRPRPPAAVVDVLTGMARMKRPRLVVDLGSGTGLSTRIWADVAEKVIGIEPSPDMRREAVRRTTARNITYRRGLSHKTGLPDACADIVTCSQSLHWMEPRSTLREVKRILRPGGVFAAIDCDWPPATSCWEVERAYLETRERRGKLARRGARRDKTRKWPKEEHLARMRASGRFRYTREVLLHNVETGSAERIVGLALSMGSIQALLKSGLSESDLGLDQLRAAARRAFGDGQVPWHFSYRVRIGVV